jgi:hypothetical protein
MNEKQKLAFGNDFGLVYYPYDFKDAIDNHCEYSYNDTQKYDLSEMGKFWKFIENRNWIWKEKSDLVNITQSNPNEVGTLTFVGLGVEKIEIQTENDVSTINLVKSIFKGMMVGNIEIDFNKPVKSIMFYFRYDIAEPYELKINLEKYKKVKTIDDQSLYKENMKVDFAIGQGLVNIYFQKAKKEVTLIKVELYKVFDKSESRLISTYIIPNERFYLSITGLAYGVYEFKVLQYEATNSSKLVVESDKVRFTLYDPYPTLKRAMSRR